MKQLLKYPGGKWKIAEWIISHFPEHKIYLEPFFGSGAVFFNKTPVYTETINDIDGNVVNLFRVCRDHPEELARLMMLTPFSREEYTNCYENSDDSIEQARRTLVRYHQSFGTSNSNRKSWRNIQTYGGPRTATMWNCLPEIIRDVAIRLKEAQIECTDALTLIERYDDKNTLVYIDPPYLQELRRRDIYRKEMKESSHKELLSLIKSSKSKIVISGYDNELYNTELEGWYTDTASSQAQSGGLRREKIWMNYSYQLSLF